MKFIENNCHSNKKAVESAICIEPLRRKKDFVLCYNAGKRFYSKHFVFFVLQHRPAYPTRTGITVSRKVGCAVLRNRIKRLLREFFRLSVSILPTSCDIVAVAKKQISFGQLKLNDITNELMPLFTLKINFAVTKVCPKTV